MGKGGRGGGGHPGKVGCPGKADHRTIGPPWYRYVQQTLLVCNTKVQTSNCLWWQMICKELTFIGCSWGQYLLSTYLHTHKEMKGSLRCLTSPRDLQRQPYTCYACLTHAKFKTFQSKFDIKNCANKLQLSWTHTSITILYMYIYYI